MLRFDYNVQENGIVEVKVISEEIDTSSLCGKLTMRIKEWDVLWKTLGMSENSRKNFDFVNKGEPE